MTSTISSFRPYTNYVNSIGTPESSAETIEAFTRALCEKPEQNHMLITEWIAKVSQTENQELIRTVSTIVAKVRFKNPNAPH